MKSLVKKPFWLINLLFLALGAYLIALTINALIAHDIRAAAVRDSASTPVRNTKHTQTKRRDYQIIAERNYFDSAKAIPAKSTLSPEANALLLQFEPHLNSKTVRRLFEVGKAFIHRRDGSQKIYAHCNIVEGRWCFFGEKELLSQYDAAHDPQIEDEAHRIPADLALEITNQIGPKHIEHARYNAVKIRCSKPGKSPDLPSCELDWGWAKGWKNLVRNNLLEVQPGIPPVRYNDTRTERITMESNTVVQKVPSDVLEKARRRAGLEPAYRDRR